MIKSLLEDEENQPLEATPEIKSERTIETPFDNFPEMETKQSVANFSESNVEQTPVNSFEKENSEEVYNFKFEEAPMFQSVEKPMFQTDFKPDSPAETIRKSGLAYAAGITLFASIVFSMALGWFVDLMFGTSPWGIVSGIVLGSIIGFIQFFRITSQIIKDKD
jgi:F0F1-type ATP synthase assembly protein I